MVLTSGFYRVSGGRFHLVPEQSQPSVVTLTSAMSPPVTTRFRRDKDSWLSLDDGLVGKHGTPEHVRATIAGKTYRVWVEQRGKDEFGLIPTEESGEYSNKFLGVSADGKLTIEDEWKEANGTVWIISSEWEGQGGV